MPERDSHNSHIIITGSNNNNSNNSNNNIMMNGSALMDAYHYMTVDYLAEEGYCPTDRTNISEQYPTVCTGLECSCLLRV